MTTQTYKAQAIGDTKVPDLNLVANEPYPSFASCHRSDKTMHREAVKIVDALQASLPGGVFDQIFAEMARRKASQLVVPL